MSAVSVLVMDCTTIGALPPMVTAPTFTPRDVLREIMPRLYQGHALRHAHHPGTGDFVVPGLLVAVESDPDKAKADDHHGKEAAERAHDGRLPVYRPAVHTHHPQIEDTAPDRRAPRFPAQGAVCGEHHEFKVVFMMEHAHEKADQHEIEQQRDHAYAKARPRQGCRDRRRSRRL